MKATTKKAGIKVVEFGDIKQLFTDSKIENQYLYQPLMPFKIKVFEPYRTGFYGIGLIHKGNISLFTDLYHNKVTAPALIVMGPDVVRQWDNTGNNFHLEAIFFTEQFRQSKQMISLSFHGFDFFDCHGKHVFPLKNAAFKQLSLVFNMIQSRIDTKQTYELEVIHHSIAILINEIKTLYTEKPPSHRHKPLIVKFKKAATQFFREHHTVEYYAKHLHVNAKHLSQTLKKETGKTAGEWIQELLILESKVLLQEAELSINQIADILHFSDQSMFGKFFKKHTHLTPSQYRDNLQIDQ